MPITTLYINQFTHDKAIRREEFDACLRRNLDNPLIDRIVILAQSTPSHRAQFTSPKIVWHDLPNQDRPPFRRYFDAVNHYTTTPYDLNIVSNADIYFDQTLAPLKELDLQNACIALSRWEVPNGDGPPVVKVWDNSQDVWIFQGRVRPLGDCSFAMGIFGCDNRLAWLLRHADYKVVNPVYDVKAYHLHHSGIRNNGRNVGGNYANVTRTSLADCKFGPRRPVLAGVIAFSLYGNNPMYVAGAIENAKLARWVYPGWTCRFYVDDSVPAETIKKLKELKAEVVTMSRGNGAEGKFWRLLVADEPGWGRWIIRDCDSRLGYRERRAVDEWIASGKPFHVMRDHPHHVNPIMGGMWGGTRGHLPWPLREKITQWRAGRNAMTYNDDERFLADVVWPVVSGSAVVHDSFGSGGTPFPTPMENWCFVGERIYQDEHRHGGGRNAIVGLPNRD